MTINELQDNVIEEFSVFDDWMDKYALLIDLGNSLPPLDEKYKTESNLIEGCQSRVWFQADYVDGKIIFQGESDAVFLQSPAADAEQFRHFLVRQIPLPIQWRTVTF